MRALIGALTAAFAALVLVSAFVSSIPRSADAQTDERSGAIEPDPDTEGQYREIRPQEALRRGSIDAPAWFVAALGSALAVAAATVLVHRIVRRRR